MIRPGDPPEVDPPGVRREHPGEPRGGAELIPLARHEGDRRRHGVEGALVEEVERWPDRDHVPRR